MTITAVPDGTYNPDYDGRTHCNVYSKGRTPLGRSLSNFAHTPFVHPVYGHFASVEGFWYFLGTGCKHQDLRRLYGMSAKSVGRQYEQVPMENFDEQIEEAICLKILQNPIIRGGILANDLPYAHYLVFGSSKYRIVDKTAESGYLWNAIARIRAMGERSYD